MRLSVLPDEAVLRNPDWVAPMLFVLRLLRSLLVRTGRVPRRGCDAARPRHVAQDPLFDRFVQYDPELGDRASHGALTRPRLHHPEAAITHGGCR